MIPIVFNGLKTTKGVSDGSLQDEFISSSSVYGSSPLFAPKNARLHQKQGNGKKTNGTV